MPPGNTAVHQILTAFTSGGFPFYKQFLDYLGLKSVQTTHSVCPKQVNIVLLIGFTFLIQL